jgi:hypothetical protein
MTGQWQEVPKTIQERRDLLARLSSSAQPQDQQWLNALRQAMRESDAAVAQIAQAAASAPVGPGAPAHPARAPFAHPCAAASAGQSVVTEPTDAVAAIMDMLGKGA